ncbi:MAG: ABC transporter permease [Phycisphaeraceae bacterium]|nr:ABC transporter permease [Phycisphaeraceae bacterium]
MLKPYAAIGLTLFRTLLQYRAAALAALSTQIVFGWIIVMVYEALYASRRGDAGMPLEQVITYVWLGQAFLGNLPWGVDKAVAVMMRDGSVGIELCRPVDLYTAWYARLLAIRMGPTLLRAVPMFILAMLFFGMKPPVSVAGGAAFVVAMIGAVALSSAITMLVNISLFWTINPYGMSTIIGSLLVVFSGQDIPLPLMPGWLRSISEMLPFRGVVDVPFRLYTGHLPAGGAWRLLAFQWMWIAALVIGGRALMRAGMRRVVVQGG